MMVPPPLARLGLLALLSAPCLAAPIVPSATPTISTVSLCDDPKVSWDRKSEEGCRFCLSPDKLPPGIFRKYCTPVNPATLMEPVEYLWRRDGVLVDPDVTSHAALKGHSNVMKARAQAPEPDLTGTAEYLSDPAVTSAPKARRGSAVKDWLDSIGFPVDKPNVPVVEVNGGYKAHSVLAQLHPLENEVFRRKVTPGHGPVNEPPPPLDASPTTTAVAAHNTIPVALTNLQKLHPPMHTGFSKPKLHAPAEKPLHPIPNPTKPRPDPRPIDADLTSGPTVIRRDTPTDLEYDQLSELIAPKDTHASGSTSTMPEVVDPVDHDLTLDGNTNPDPEEPLAVFAPRPILTKTMVHLPRPTWPNAHLPEPYKPKIRGGQMDSFPILPRHDITQIWHPSPAEPAREFREERLAVRNMVTLVPAPGIYLGNHKGSASKVPSPILLPRGSSESKMTGFDSLLSGKVFVHDRVDDIWRRDDVSASHVEHVGRRDAAASERLWSARVPDAHYGTPKGPLSDTSPILETLEKVEDVYRRDFEQGSTPEVNIGVPAMNTNPASKSENEELFEQSSSAFSPKNRALITEIMHPAQNLYRRAAAQSSSPADARMISTTELQARMERSPRDESSTQKSMDEVTLLPANGVYHRSQDGEAGMRSHEAIQLGERERRHADPIPPPEFLDDLTWPFRSGRITQRSTHQVAPSIGHIKDSAAKIEKASGIGSGGGSEVDELKHVRKRKRDANQLKDPGSYVAEIHLPANQVFPYSGPIIGDWSSQEASSKVPRRTTENDDAGWKNQRDDEVALRAWQKYQDDCGGLLAFRCEPECLPSDPWPCVPQRAIALPPTSTLHRRTSRDADISKLEDSGYDPTPTPLYHATVASVLRHKTQDEQSGSSHSEQPADEPKPRPLLVTDHEAQPQDSDNASHELPVAKSGPSVRWQDSWHVPAIVMAPANDVHKRSRTNGQETDESNDPNEEENGRVVKILDDGRITTDFVTPTDFPAGSVFRRTHRVDFDSERLQEPKVLWNIAEALTPANIVDSYGKKSKDNSKSKRSKQDNEDANISRGDPTKTNENSPLIPDIPHALPYHAGFVGLRPTDSVYNLGPLTEETGQEVDAVKDRGKGDRAKNGKGERENGKKDEKDKRDASGQYQRDNYVHYPTDSIYSYRPKGNGRKKPTNKRQVSPDDGNDDTSDIPSFRYHWPPGLRPAIVMRPASGLNDGDAEPTYKRQNHPAEAYVEGLEERSNHYDKAYGERKAQYQALSPSTLVYGLPPQKRAVSPDIAAAQHDEIRADGHSRYISLRPVPGVWVGDANPAVNAESNGGELELEPYAPSAMYPSPNLGDGDARPTTGDPEALISKRQSDSPCSYVQLAPVGSVGDWDASPTCHGRTVPNSKRQWMGNGKPSVLVPVNSVGDFDARPTREKGNGTETVGRKWRA